MDNFVEIEIDRYSELYKKRRTGWHQNQVNEILLKHTNLFPNPNPKYSKSIFLPLCGKSKDIPYLLTLGYRIFGVEAVQQAILELDEENSLKLECNEENIYETSDKNLIIYNGDIFKCTIEKYGPFDSIWDKASFSVFPESLRSKYVEVMRRALKEESKYLLEVYDYDKKLSDGKPPRATSKEDIQELFGQFFNIQQIEKIPATPQFFSHFKHLENTSCNQITYLLIPKL